MAIRFKLTLLLVIFFVSSIKANPVKFYSINSLFGISFRVTGSICKDNNGFIWASSKTGILRLTNDDYRIYQLPYETADIVIVRLVYEDSKLIAFSNNGQIFLYNPVYDRFDLLLNLSSILNFSDNFEIYALLIDDSGNYWIASNKGLYKYNSGKLSFIDKLSKERYALKWFDEQHIIIATDDGIRLFDIQSLKSKTLYEIKNISPFLASSLFLDKIQNKLWIGTLSNGLFCYNFSSGTLTHILKASIPMQPILAVKEKTASSILIGIDGQGVWELNKDGAQIINVYKESADDPYSLRGNGVYDIFCDHGSRVWICTFNGGVSFFDMTSPLIKQIIHQTNDANSLVNNDINSIIEDRTGKLWFATNNGISCWNVASNTWKNFYYNKLEQAQVFLSLCEDDQGRIWAGSYSSGIYILDGKTGRELAHYCRGENGLESISNFIFDIFKDSQGDLWVGGINGEFACYLSKENRFKTYSEVPVSSFAELAPGQILFGCNYGISLLNKQTGEIKNLLSGIAVQDILVLGEDVWGCSSGEGLIAYNYKNGTIEKFTTQSGLPSNFTNSIAYADNYLWIGTENGLCRFNPKDKTILTFSTILPLSSISYNKSSVSTLKSGQLAWGTNNGAVFFAPNSIIEQPSKGKIFFHDLTISGRSIRDIPTFKLNTPVDSLHAINLKYFQNTISLELLPVGVLSGAKFSWKMDGFDKDWIPPTINRIITYTNIPSGKYCLKVRLLDSSMANILSERSIAICLIPPFWRTGWFIMLLLIIITGIISLYLLLYINRLKQKHTEEKVRFFTNTAHDIRTSLTLIKAPVEELNKEINLSDTGRYYLNLAIEQAKRLSSVVTQLMDFQKVDIGKDHLSLSMVDIVRLIINRKLMCDSFAKSKNINLVLSAN